MATDFGDKGSVQPRRSRGETQTATVRYVDRPECTETFADSINNVYFDGQSLRIEFGVTRLDDVKPNTPVTGRRLSGAADGADADGRGRIDQPHATGRRGAGAGRRAEGQSDADQCRRAADNELEIGDPRHDSNMRHPV